MEQKTNRLINIKKVIEEEQRPFLFCEDYTVSNDKFKLYYNDEFDLLFTHPIPNNLEDYYKSEKYISHTDSNKSLIDKIYKLVRTYTLKKKLKLINSFNLSDKKILDIGAGTGDFLKICKDNNWIVKGVEPSNDAKQIALKKGIEITDDIKKYANERFDVITMWHVLEHVTNLEEYILLIKKILKPNGKLIIAVPNYKSYDATYYKEHWAAYDVPRHIWHFSKNSIARIFLKFEMKVLKELPMKFDSYYVSLLSEKYKTGKMKPLNSFYRGFLSNFKAIKTKEHSSIIYILNNVK